MIKFRSHSFHYLTEAFQIFTRILEMDFFLLIQKLKEKKGDNKGDYFLSHLLKSLETFTFKFAQIISQYSNYMTVVQKKPLLF